MARRSMSWLLRCHRFEIRRTQRARAMGHPFLNEIKDAACNLGQPRIGRRERVELVAVKDQESDLVIIVNVFIEDLDSDNVADDVDGAIMVASNPDEAEVIAVRVATNDLETSEMPFRQSFEVQVVKDIAVDDELIAMLHGPDQEPFEQLRLADLAAQVQVADDDTVVVMSRSGQIKGFGGVSIARLR